MGCCEHCGQPNPGNHVALEECLTALKDRIAEMERISDGAIAGWRRAVALRDGALHDIEKLAQNALDGPR